MSCCSRNEHLDPESFCRRNAKDHVATLARLRLIRASSCFAGNLPSYRGYLFLISVLYYSGLWVQLLVA